MVLIKLDTEMNKNIVVKKEKPICQLEGLPGVKRDKIYAYWFKDINDMRQLLNLDMPVLLLEITEL